MKGRLVHEVLYFIELPVAIGQELVGLEWQPKRNLLPRNYYLPICLVKYAWEWALNGSSIIGQVNLFGIQLFELAHG